MCELTQVLPNVLWWLAVIQVGADYLQYELVSSVLIQSCLASSQSFLNTSLGPQSEYMLINVKPVGACF